MWSRISGRIFFDSDPVPTSGLLVIKVDDVTEIDALSVEICRSEIWLVDTDQATVDGRVSYEFALTCELPDVENRDISVSARLHVDGNKDLKAGDFSTTMAQPISPAEQIFITLRLTRI